ncbi:hypothetical protein WMO64_00295 [Pseudoflavonifractor sp. CLA-AP-H29]|uniref:Secreted protein n=1 Tax=Pseudoflavonifractor intestinihominis TaxID=3133171 RepID=A0ABV1E3L6_9FIRM
MCNCSNRRCCCCCGCSCGCSCGNGGAVTLPSFPDRPVWDSDSSGDSYPVYVAMPAFMTRGSANLQAAVELDSGSSCPCRG